MKSFSSGQGDVFDDENTQVVNLPVKIRRKYFVFDSQGKRLGPFGPEEILSLYMEKKVTKRTKVQKGTLPNLITVGTFLNVYCRERGKKDGVYGKAS